nr:response regulator [uncultured Sulfurimonas sp.]
MKILIVDDNFNNRTILRLLLQDYKEDNNVDFEVYEASDGLEALKMCKEDSFNIVFMDIMMPNKDGVEATKAIKEINLGIMIIAVSAVDDNVRKKEILDIGAEDYIAKPINADIFKSRIANYITIAEARGHQKINSRTINVFSNEIYSRHTNFIIKSEDSLSEFWEFFLLNAKKKNESLSDVVRTIFSIAEAQVKLRVKSSIYIEESDEYQYFTLTKIDKLPKGIVKLIVKKNRPECEYKITNSKISFELAKVYTQSEKEVTVVEKVDESIEDVIASPIEYSSQKLLVFDYIDGDDLYELEDYSAKLNSLMLIVGSGNITEEEVMQICGYLEKLASILATYSEIYPISKALATLSHDMLQYIQEFVKNAVDLGVMCQAFSNDMSTWIEMSFQSGAPSIDFMNDTIVVNCQTISGMLGVNNANSELSEDLDDIFDF